MPSSFSTTSYFRSLNVLSATITPLLNGSSLEQRTALEYLLSAAVIQLGSDLCG